MSGGERQRSARPWGAIPNQPRYLIITYNTSIQVYSTEDSLLVRRINLPVTRRGDGTELVSTHVVSSVLSKTDPDYIWVACSDGRIWRINWTSGAGADSPFMVDTKKLLDMTVDVVEMGGSSEDVLLVLKRLTKTSAQIVAYNTKALSTGNGKLLHTYDESPQMLRSVAGGRLIFAAAKETLHVGLLQAKKPLSLDDLSYRFHCFGIPDIVSCLDIRPTVRPTKKGGIEIQSVDIAVGCARGAIYVYNDLLSNLPGDGSGSSKAGPIQPRKYHWHRRAVHSVKWSEDGKHLFHLAQTGSRMGILTGNDRQLPHFWRLRGRSCSLAAGHRKAGFPTPSVGDHREHRRLAPRFVLRDSLG